MACTATPRLSLCNVGRTLASEMKPGMQKKIQLCLASAAMFIDSGVPAVM